MHADSKNRMCECYAAKKMIVKSFPEDVATALKLGDGTEESPYKEEPGLRESDSLHAGTVVRRGMRVGRTDDWSELLKSDELDPWTAQLVSCRLFFFSPPCGGTFFS